MQPLLLVCEDLHWIDTETQALLDSLVESLPDGPAPAAGQLPPGVPARLGQQDLLHATAARPPAARERGRFLQALLGDDPSLAPLTPLLIARTEGNPFFLEESVRTLVETGVLVGEPGAYRLAQATADHPGAGHGAGGAGGPHRPPARPRRSACCRRPPSLGPRCPCPCCRPLPSVPETALHRGLAHLQAAEFLYETRLFPDHAYTFKHALTHEVAYGSLLQERRRVLHARIVEALEALAEGAGDRPGRAAWPTMPCEAKCGTRPWPTAGRRGRRPWRGRSTPRRSRPLSKR